MNVISIFLVTEADLRGWSMRSGPLETVETDIYIYIIYLFFIKTKIIHTFEIHTNFTVKTPPPKKFENSILFSQ